MRQSGRNVTFAAVAPYVAWMGLMMTLPPTAWAYAVRTAVTAALLAWGVLFTVPVVPGRFRTGAGALGWGVAVGVLVCALWILPERFAWYRAWFVLGDAPAPAASPYDPAACGWPLTAVRLAGSAFVIAPVEELFFRSFLYRWLQRREWRSVPMAVFDASAFFWMVGLFALEHNRWLAGAMAGAAYGLVAIRKGLGAAVVAHVVTNLLLGLYVIQRGEWNFW